MKKNSLVGTYELLSWENRYESGRIHYPLGPEAKGVISYSADGFVFVHIMADNREKHAGGELFGGEISEIRNSETTHKLWSGSPKII